ncbi:MAG: class I SAM-dependent methyltransferase [Lachnospiraceae bacterium]|nr:class I SAM-dependent methyltransferase [Lachnospiraceae bacterium]
MVLSKRLAAIADMVEPCDTVTDVGCDHGYLSIWLLEQGICSMAIASDIRKGPLECAKKNRDEHGIGGDRMKLISSDGLKDIDIPDISGNNTLIIAGMGGENMIDILSFDKEKAHAYKKYIFSPHTKLPEFRKYLDREGYYISDEKYVFDTERMYTVIKAENGKANELNETDYLLGPYIKTAVLDRKVRNELEKRYKAIMKLASGNDLPEEKMSELKKEIKIYEEVLRK